jgi:6-phospho-3-hexuloisomerase
MADASFRVVSEGIVEELRRALAGVSEEQVRDLRRALLNARAVFVTGEGRSGLVGRCFAMRLMHLGIAAHVVGETVTPAIGKGDLLVAISGSGESEVTCVRARQAKALGARVVGVTGAEKSPLVEAAELALVISTVERSVQYGGTGFEQAALLVLDGIALQLQRELGRSAEEMDARHASVE